MPPHPVRPAAARCAARSARWAGRRRDLGMVTVEYAMGTLAAAFLATVLWLVAHNPAVLSTITHIFVGSLSSLH